MNLALWFTTFVHDDKVKAILVLIAVDFILGVAAAFKTNTFQLSYFAQFARDDLLGKVVPYFVLYAASIVVGGSGVLGSWVTFNTLSDSLFAIVVAAMVGSIYKSLADLGLNLPLPPALNKALK